MAIGAQHVVRFHEDAVGTDIFDSFTRHEFTHDASFVTPSKSVKFEDYPANHRDAFVVKTSYPNGSEPDLTATTVDDLLQAAKTDVNNAIAAGATGGGAPSTPV
jgi:hypothetical protein